MSDERIPGHTQILAAVRRVRRRWRLRIALRGLAWVLGLSVVVLFLSALGLEHLRFSASAVVWLRVLTWGTLLASTLLLLIRPLVRNVTDEQVALYLEEHEPSLELSVVSALEAGGTPTNSGPLTHRLLQSALERIRRVDHGKRVEQSRLYRFGGILTLLAVAALGLAMLGPTHLRNGLAALLLPARDAATVNPYAIGVRPGDTTIARGTDQVVTADLSGFEAADASVFTRTGSEGPFQRLSMLPADGGGFEILLLGVEEPTQYFVEATGVRSTTYTLDVADLPHVDRMELTSHFPAYTGLPDRTVEDGGDVAALPGTVIEVRIHPTMATPGGALRVDSAPPTELSAVDDSTLTGRFTVRAPGFYSVALARSDGELVPASPEYKIDVLDDHEPSVRFDKPGRDSPASPIEEVYLQVRADDDYGVGDVRLVYSVNGGPEDTVPLFQARDSAMSEVSVGHTLFLEEFGLEPGDLVSYYALARDNRTLGSPRAVASDIYFLNIRPFEQAFKQSEQQGGGASAGGQQGVENPALSDLQRQIIAATFNLQRQRDSYADDEFAGNVVSVSLAQGRLKDQVENLLQRMQTRGLTGVDSTFRDVATLLPNAAEAMQKARDALDRKDLEGAMPSEQEALRFLQQAEQTYEVYVQRQQQGQQGGGGGGQQQASAEDLADLFELELDKLKNQYETVQRGQREQTDNQADELLERLKELARRQQQEAERQRLRAQRSAQGSPTGGSQSQRELADSTEEAARQLQRLARQNNDAQMEETARRLQQAAEAMRRAASQSGNASASEAGSALQRLQEAQRRLEEARADRARRDTESALDQVDELTRQQRQVENDVRELPADGDKRAQDIARIRERKDQMTHAVEGLEQQLDRAASDARADHPEAARKLQGAAEQIRESKLKEKLQYSRGTIEQWDRESAVTLELNIESDLQALHDQLEQARDAAGQRQEDPLKDALEGTRDLLRGVEAMNRRLHEPTTDSAAQGSGGEGQDRQSQQAGGQPNDRDQRGERGRQDGRQANGQQNDQGRRGEQEQDRQRGQQGQQGQQGDGQQEGGARTGSPSALPLTGQRTGPSGSGELRPLSPDDIRQFRSEARERTAQAEALRDRLREAGRDPRDLQAVVDAMRRLQNEGAYADPANLSAIQDEVVQALKRLEFSLRRDVETTSGRRATLSGSDEVPEGYRKMVEEYYKALAKTGNGGG